MATLSHREGKVCVGGWRPWRRAPKWRRGEGGGSFLRVCVSCRSISSSCLFSFSFFFSIWCRTSTNAILTLVPPSSSAQRLGEDRPGGVCQEPERSGPGFDRLRRNRQIPQRCWLACQVRALACASPPEMLLVP